MRRTLAQYGFYVFLAVNSLVVFLLVFLPVNSASATAGIPTAYYKISKKYGIPVEVFYSMILQESGRTVNGRYHPWPWTLNVNHKAYRYDSQREAVKALYQFMDGKNTIAVGLGQIYLPAHGHVFEDPFVLLDPRINLEYAAILLATEFLYTVKKKNPNWWEAVGRYHAPSNKKYAHKYRREVFEKCLKITRSCINYGALH